MALSKALRYLLLSGAGAPVPADPFDTAMAAAIAAIRAENGSMWFNGRAADLAGFVYQDSVGTTAATGTNPVGLELDRSYGTSNLGSELVTNGTFDSGTTGWSVTGGSGGSIANVGGELEITSSGSGVLVSSPITTIIGQTYRIVVTARKGTYPGSPDIGLNTADNLAPSPAISVSTTSNVTAQINYVATTTTSYVLVRFPTVAAGTAYVDNVSVKQVLGIPALQSTSGNRYNLELQGSGYYALNPVNNPSWFESITFANTTALTLVNAQIAASPATLQVHIGTGDFANNGLVIYSSGSAFRGYANNSANIFINGQAMSAGQAYVTICGCVSSGNLTFEQNGVASSPIVGSGRIASTSLKLGSSNSGTQRSLGKHLLFAAMPSVPSAPNLAAIRTFAGLLVGLTL